MMVDTYMYGDVTDEVEADAPEEFVKIPVIYYRNLLADQSKLVALMSAGVDSWEGYELALDILSTFKTPEPA